LRRIDGLGVRQVEAVAGGLVEVAVSVGGGADGSVARWSSRGAALLTRGIEPAIGQPREVRSLSDALSVSAIERLLVARPLSGVVGDA